MAHPTKKIALTTDPKTGAVLTSTVVQAPVAPTTPIKVALAIPAAAQAANANWKPKKVHARTGPTVNPAYPDKPGTTKPEPPAIKRDGLVHEGRNATPAWKTQHPKDTTGTGTHAHAKVTTTTTTTTDPATTPAVTTTTT